MVHDYLPDARARARDAEIAALRRRDAALEARLAALVDDPWAGWHFDSEHPVYAWFCGYCHARGNEDDTHSAPRHAPDCPITKARAALARGATGAGEGEGR